MAEDTLVCNYPGDSILGTPPCEWTGTHEEAEVEVRYGKCPECGNELDSLGPEQI